VNPNPLHESKSHKAIVKETSLLQHNDSDNDVAHKSSEDVEDKFLKPFKLSDEMGLKNQIDNPQEDNLSAIDNLSLNDYKFHKEENKDKEPDTT